MLEIFTFPIQGNKGNSVSILQMKMSCPKLCKKSGRGRD